VLLTGCPACAVSEGPPWARARAGAAGVATRAGVLWLIGGDEGGAASAATDRVVWSEGAPRIEPGPDLVAARSEAAVIEHASGIVSVFGGRGADGARDDVELCLSQDGLDPL
jgi:hypothetical protein